VFLLRRPESCALVKIMAGSILARTAEIGGSVCEGVYEDEEGGFHTQVMRRKTD
jgi:hypothetical protein